ncbi:MAG: hypothetical protein P8Y37_10740, partial [Anaerolineales bacterium]
AKKLSQDRRVRRVDLLTRRIIDSKVDAVYSKEEEQIEKIVPLSEMKDLIKERTNFRDFGVFGTFFKSNPKVDDIPEKYSIMYEGVRFLQFGLPKEGGSGCYCAENELIRELMKHLLIENDDVVIMDMEAGIEHLGRATVDFVDAMIIVVEPTQRSLGTAAQIKTLSRDIGLKRLWLVGNKIRSEEEISFLKENSPGLPLLGTLPMDLGVLDADRLGEPVYDHVPSLREAAAKIASQLQEPYPQEFLQE